MKKLIALLLALVMVLGLAACGAKEEAAAPAATEAAPAATEAAPAATEAAPAEKPFEGKTLRVATSGSSQEKTMGWYDAWVPAFEEETGANVEVIFNSTEERALKQKTDLLGGTSPDILYVTGGEVFEYVTNGYIQDLTGLFSDEQIADWPFYDDYAVNGVPYVVPYNGGAAYRYVAMNVSMCKELGLEVPAYDAMTWDLFVEYAKKAVEAGYKGYCAPFSGNFNACIMNYYAYVCQAGGTISDENGLWHFEGEEPVEAFQFIYDMFNTYKIIDTVSYDDQSAKSEFIEGNCLFTTVNISGLQNPLNDGSITFEAMGYNLRNDRTAAFNTADSFAIAHTCEEPELAAAFISYLMTPEVYNDFRARISSASCCVESVNAAADLRPEVTHIPGDVDYAIFDPAADVNTAQISEQLIVQQQLVALGDATPEEAVQTLRDLVASLKA